MNNSKRPYLYSFLAIFLAFLLSASPGLEAANNHYGLSRELIKSFSKEESKYQKEIKSLSLQIEEINKKLKKENYSVKLKKEVLRLKKKREKLLDKLQRLLDKYRKQQGVQDKTDEPQGTSEFQFWNSVEHGRQDSFEKMIGPTGEEEPPGEGNEPTCTVQDAIGLVGEELTQYVRTTDRDCLRYLWDYDEDVANVLSSENMATVLNEIERLAPDYDGTNVQGMLSLLFFARVGYFQFFYHPELNYGAMVDEAFFEAFDALGLNDDLYNATAQTPSRILREWIVAIDTAGFIGNYLEQFKRILRNYITQPERRTLFYQNSSAYSILFGLQRIRSSRVDAEIDEELIELIKAVGLLDDLEDRYRYIANNAIWTLGRLIGFQDNMDEAIVECLTAILDESERLGESYIWVVGALDDFNDCETSREGETVCREDVVPELEAQLFPNTYSFDDGVLQVRTPLELEPVQTLYHAVKQVQSQFNRISETITPLIGDPNPTLNLIVYGTRREYEIYQPFLYGLGTRNGGIYIEQRGTFYTYERTPEESSFTLEELFRHEYSHYLIGRYLIEGFWGEEPIYENSRMVWFDEGMAEFLTWSNQKEISARRGLVERIEDDGEDRLAVADILSASYSGGFTFYRYAGLFVHYLYTHEKSILMNLIRIVHDSDVARYDALIEQLSNDVDLNASYQSYLDELIADLESLSDPSTATPELESLSTNDLLQIQEEFRGARLGYLGECSLSEMTINSRFSCRGYLTGRRTQEPDESADWTRFDAGLNEIIEHLSESELINNFQFMNCRMGRIRRVEYPNGESYPISDYFCDGPLLAGEFELLEPLVQVTEDFRQTRLGGNARCELEEPEHVICRLAITTRLVGEEVEDAFLEHKLETYLAELQNQVYATRPSYYRDFSCEFSAPSRVLDAGEGQRYMSRPVQCRDVIE